MALFRYGYSEYKRQKRRLFVAIFGTITLLVFILLFGFPILMNFSLLVDRLRGTVAPSQTSERLLPPVLDPLPEATNSSALTISGRGTAGLMLLLYNNDQETKKLTVSENGDFTASLLGNEGENTIYGVLVGSSDAKSQPSNTISTVIINKPPMLEVITPQDNELYSGDASPLSVEGKTDQGISITVNNRFVIVQNDGTFRSSVRLNEGENIVKVEAKDKAGNVNAIERKINYQN